MESMGIYDCMIGNVMVGNINILAPNLTVGSKSLEIQALFWGSNLPKLATILNNLTQITGTDVKTKS